MEKKNYYVRLNRIVKLSFVSVALLISSLTIGQTTSGLKLHYTFGSATNDIVSDASGNGYSGTLMNGATVGVAPDGKNVLILGSDGDDYLDMGTSTGGLIASLTDFSLCSDVYVAEATDLTANGNFVCCFSNSAANITDLNGYAFLQAKRSRYAITLTSYGAEEPVQTGIDIDKGRWVHMAYTQTGTTGTLYIDGLQVATSDAISLNPSSLGLTAFNFIGRPCYAGDAYLTNAMISDFRLYNRTLTSAEVLAIAYPTELNSQYDALTAEVLSTEDLTEVTTSLTLPTTLGTNGVTVSWTSSETSVIAVDGTVTQPAKVNTTVVLTAVLSYTNNGITYTRNKEFEVTVISVSNSYVVAKWNFPSSSISLDNGDVKIMDASGNDYVGTLKDVAAIRTIGNTTTGQYNVIDLGNSAGYFDMGTELGKAIYSLNNFTIGTYFRINKTYTGITSGGNFIWNFSNTADANNTATGYIIGILTGEKYKITPTNWSSEAGLSVGSNPSTDTWHHIAYTQNGTVGTLYLDGVSVSTGTVSRKPSVDLVKTGLTGTLYNWIGRSCYTGDVYLKKTLIYGLQIDSYPYSKDDLNSEDNWNVTSTLTKLNAAYSADSLYNYSELDVEMAALSLGDLSGVTTDITDRLITSGTIDPTISISYKMSSTLITGTGVVTRPSYLDATVTITAVLMKNGQTRTKTFTATVKAAPGTLYSSDVLLNYDFAADKVSGTVVTDASEKKFTGTLMKSAVVSTISKDGKSYNVLNLPSDSAYFDMGTECGKLIYGLRNYSISVYFVVGSAKTNFASNGNFLYTFSNSAKAGTDRNGYMYARASYAVHCVSQYYYSSGNVATTGTSTTPSIGTFHHFVFTQNDTLGTSILDGDTISSIKFANIPAIVIPKTGLTGTLYNFLGRSNYVGDVYLAPSLMADFKLFNKVLTSDEIKAMQETRTNLDAAYKNTPVTGIITKNDNKLVLNTTVPGLIQIVGLKGTEKVAVFDLLGRRVVVSNVDAISVKPGIYIVRVDNKVTKVIVQ